MKPLGAPACADVTLVVLAGGEGRRMGGVDKGLQPFRGRPLIEHVIERVGPQTAGVLISANRNRDQYARYGYPVTADLRPDFPGPLAGIEAALTRLATPWALVAPCDLPGLPLDLRARLGAALDRSGTGAAVACSQGRRHAVLLLPADCLELVRRLLDGDERRVRALIDALSACEVDFALGDDGVDAFANVNTRADLGGC